MNYQDQIQKDLRDALKRAQAQDKKATTELMKNIDNVLSKKGIK